MERVRKEKTREISVSDVPKEVKTYVFDVLKEPNYFEENTLTAKDIRRLSQAVRRFKLGVQGNIIQICSTNCESIKRCPLIILGRAPIGEDCHPPKEGILTKSHGEIPIELLDPEIHELPTFFVRANAIRGLHNRAKKFRVTSRQHYGTMFTITTKNGKTSKVTGNHLCIAKFNRQADSKFCVYLMRKGDLWRIGKTFILRLSGINGKCHQGTLMRLTGEGADAMWILGVYNTNTEAFLAEEYFSIKFQISKVCFSDSIKNKKHKTNGAYKWATKGQLIQHHESLKKPTSYYKELLSDLGLSIDYPYMIKNGFRKDYIEKGPYPRYPMLIRAYNLIPEIMDVPTLPDYDIVKELHTRKYKLCEWEKISIQKTQYDGTVYSLDVEGPHHTYFAGKIATHNCSIELDLFETRRDGYLSSTKERYKNMGGDPDDVERDQILMTLISEMVEADLVEFRVNALIADAGMVEEVPVLATEHGVECRPDEATAIKIKDRFKKRRDIILKQLILTPEMIHKTKTRALDESPQKRIHEAREKAKALMMEKHKQIYGSEEVKEIEAKEVIKDG